MTSATLASTNPYLRDPVARERSVFTSVSSSSAIEGIHAPFKAMAAQLKVGTVPKKQKQRVYSTRVKP